MNWLTTLMGCLAALFGTVTLITPDPMNVDATVTIRLAEPVSASSERAYLFVKLADLAYPSVFVLDLKSVLDKRCPPGSLKATLSSSESGISRSFTHRGGFLQGRDGADLLMTPDDAVPTNVDFDTLTLTAEEPLTGVTVHWSDVGRK